MTNRLLTTGLRTLLAVGTRRVSLELETEEEPLLHFPQLTNS